MDLKGIVTVINTPFDHSGGIDKDGLRKHLRYAINSGVKGFLIPAMASEVLKLSESEKELLVKIALEEAGTDVAVIAGTSAYTQRTIRKFCQIPGDGMPGFVSQYSFCFCG